MLEGKPEVDILASDQAPGWREDPFSMGHAQMCERWLALGPETMY